MPPIPIIPPAPLWSLLMAHQKRRKRMIRGRSDVSRELHTLLLGTMELYLYPALVVAFSTA